MKVGCWFFEYLCNIHTIIKELDKFFHNLHCPLYGIISSFKHNYVLCMSFLMLLVRLVSKHHHVILCLQEMLVSILLCWRKYIKVDYSFWKLTSLLIKIFLIHLLYNLYAFIVWITPNKGVGYWYSSKLVDYVIPG
jgi:hypothetical protein